ncbi:hypothetical protein [Lentzea flava]|uniref:hypothetical protein n=1 Tax=Lentzea flava TaxID=103732 RepID=UPI0016717648|nr:hypothetical protein [Lentzea flava]
MRPSTHPATEPSEPAPRARVGGGQFVEAAADQHLDQGGDLGQEVLARLPAGQDDPQVVGTDTPCALPATVSPRRSAHRIREPDLSPEAGFEDGGGLVELVQQRRLMVRERARIEECAGQFEETREQRRARFAVVVGVLLEPADHEERRHETDQDRGGSHGRTRQRYVPPVRGDAVEQRHTRCPPQQIATTEHTGGQREEHEVLQPRGQSRHDHRETGESQPTTQPAEHEETPDQVVGLGTAADEPPQHAGRSVDGQAQHDVDDRVDSPINGGPAGEPAVGVAVGGREFGRELLVGHGA